MRFAGRRARNHDRRRQRTKRRRIHGGRRIGDHRRIRHRRRIRDHRRSRDHGRIRCHGASCPGRLVSAGRLGRTRRRFAVGTQALNRGARQIVGIAPFIRRNRSLDGGGRCSRDNRSRRDIHGLHGRRQYDPDLFLFARRRCLTALVVSRAFGRFHIGLGIGRLGIGRLGIRGFGYRVWRQPSRQLWLRFSLGPFQPPPAVRQRSSP